MKQAPPMSYLRDIPNPLQNKCNNICRDKYNVGMPSCVALLWCKIAMGHCHLIHKHTFEQWLSAYSKYTVTTVQKLVLC